MQQRAQLQGQQRVQLQGRRVQQQALREQLQGLLQVQQVQLRAQREQPQARLRAQHWAEAEACQAFQEAEAVTWRRAFQSAGDDLGIGDHRDDVPDAYRGGHRHADRVVPAQPEQLREPEQAERRAVQQVVLQAVVEPWLRREREPWSGSSI